MYSLTAEIKFDAAHRLSNYEGKCSRLHGHTYRAIVTVGSSKLLPWGAVMDFGDLKKLLKKFVDEKYDHKTILWAKDEENQIIGRVLGEKTVVWMNSNPTAENMAKDIYKSLTPSLRAIHKGVKLVSVELYETPTNKATYTEI